MNISKEIAKAQEKLRQLNVLLAIRKKIKDCECELWNAHEEQVKTMEDKTVALILDLVCTNFNKTLDDLRRRRRNESYIWPRYIAMRLLRDHTDLSLNGIVGLLRPAVNDHGTVLHGLCRIEKRCAVDAQFASVVKILDDTVRTAKVDGNGKIQPAKAA